MKRFNLTMVMLFGVCVLVSAQSPKKLLIPQKVWYVPDNNDYSNNDSDYSYSRMIESDNIAMFWHKEYGKNPEMNSDSSKQFNPQRAIAECERFYKFYVDDLKLVIKGNSLTDTYKLLIYVFGGNEATAFGGGEGDIGILWTPAVRINKEPYGALAHEIGHSFQYLSARDSNTGPKGPIMEMSAQYMLWQVYPDWLTFENYHLKGFLEGTHYAFLHPKNMYHSPFVLEYWSNKHGITFFGKLSRNTNKGEDVVETYKRLNNLNQEQFNDEIFDASRRFITWDLPRIDSIAEPYRNIHKSKLNAIDKGWYQIDSINAPQNYGYNAIKLEVPKQKKKLKLQFTGLAGINGYNAVKTENAGWRYGFVAYLNNGSRVYSKIYNNPNTKVEFDVPDHTQNLWLVVMGAPTIHWSIPFRKQDNNLEEQWPYKVKFHNTFPIDLGKE